MKKHKIGFLNGPGGPRGKVSITDPQQIWVKGPSLLTEIEISRRPL